MNMDEENVEKRLGSDTETRRGGIIVPGTPSSSSHDGLTASWTPGGVAEYITGKHAGGEGGDPSVVFRFTGTAGSSSAACTEVVTKPVVTSVEVLRAPLPLSRRGKGCRGIKPCPRSKKSGYTSATGEKGAGRVPEPKSDGDGNSSPVVEKGTTTQSGGTKRSKRGGRSIPRKKSRERSVEDDTSSEDDPLPPTKSRSGEVIFATTIEGEETEVEPPSEEGLSPHRCKLGGRGGPATKGKVTLRDIRERQQTLDGLEKAIALRDRILSGDYSPTRCTDRLRKRKMDLREEMPDRPLRDIAAEATAAARRIDARAVKCRNLKGGFVKDLRDDALFLEMAFDAVLTRGHKIVEDQNEGERERERLRERNRALEEEISLLKREVEERGKQVPPPPPSPLIPNKGRKRGKRGREGEQEGVALEEFPPLTFDEPSPCLPSTSLLDAEDYSDHMPDLSDSELAAPAKRGGGCGERRETGVRPASLLKQSRTPSSLNKEEVRAMIEREVSKAVEPLQRQMEMLLGEMRRLASSPSGDGARKNAPQAVPSKGTAAGRSVPEAGEGKRRKERGKGGKGKDGGGEQPLTQQLPKAPLPLHGKERPAKGEVAKPLPKKAALPREGERTGESTPGPSKDETVWTQVLGRREKRKAAQTAPSKSSRSQGGQGKGPSPKASEPKGKKAPRRRVPKTSAVVLTCPKGEYVQTMTEVRAKINLKEAGIERGLNTRTAATGAIVFEVSGPESDEKADKLASLMRAVLVDREGARVSRPKKMAEIRVRGMEASVTEEEVVTAVAKRVGCKVEEIQQGTIRAAPGGQGSLWLRLPLSAAKKAAQGTGVTAGWSQTRVDLLNARPMRCHRCLEKGHVRERCPGTIDRSQRCYRCAEPGHCSRDCRAPLRCPLCVDLGRPTKHSLGAPQCAQRNVKGTVGGNRGGVKPPSTSSQTAAGTSKVVRPGKSSSSLPPPSQPATGGSNEASLPQRAPPRSKEDGPAGEDRPLISFGDEMEVVPLGEKCGTE